MKSVRVVFISLPRDEANDLAKGIVESRLAACVNIVPKIDSYFWWDGRVEEDHEALLIVKTVADRMDDLREFVLENHPYDLPELIAVPLVEALPDYVAWIKQECREPESDID